ncbi:hypothetical protein BCR41DRAFT_400492, partial [Lobosporangium transversale]
IGLTGGVGDLRHIKDSDQNLDCSDRGDDEDDETRVAKERLAIGSLNMDDDTPELQKLSLNHSNSNGSRAGRFLGDNRSYVHQPAISGARTIGGANSSTRSQQNAVYMPYQQQHRPQQHQQGQTQPPHRLPLNSPVSWPSNDREFKRMSNSKLVLERSFDPNEQDIFDDY